MNRKVIAGLGCAGVLLVIIGFFAGIYLADTRDLEITSPAIFNQDRPKELPLLQYTFPQLRMRSYQPSAILIEEQTGSVPEFTTYTFSYRTIDKKMTGQLNIPITVTDTTPVIVMLRGYVPPEIYSTGVGTKNAAAVFAKNGFITIAPDFFGYGDSDPEPTDSWQARFEKPISVIELITTIRQSGIPVERDSENLHTTSTIGIWGHSNGGQIALSTLVTLQESIPTTLWAPVLVSFPYSLLYFTDEHDDEGKGMRIWLSQLENDYELSEFSFTNYLDGLVGPLQVQHGTNDDAALHVWSAEFMDKLAVENKRRKQLKTQQLSQATDPEVATASSEMLDPIVYNLITYPGADHNMQPSNNWDQAVLKDLEFFKKELLP